MNKYYRGLRSVVAMALLVCMLLGLSACSGNGRSGRQNIGGSETLALAQTDGEIVLENGKIRMVFNRQTGGISELANKQSGLYLTKNAQDAQPLRLCTATQTLSDYEHFAYEIAQDTAEQKSLCFTWDFADGLAVQATVSLDAQADEAVFRVSLHGNRQAQTVTAVEYPIVEGIGSLADKQTDCFLSPFVTGYLFRNPTENFNTDFFGITREYGEYPSGWGCPMQFSAYYAEGLGGFYWQTKDPTDTVKSFTMTGDGDGLRLSIYHYLSDIKDGDTDFAYDITFANLTQGSWYEAANKYRDWAQQQSWASKLSERGDVAKALYEDTTLTIFGYRVTDDWTAYSDIYDILKTAVRGTFLNIAIYKNNTYFEKIRQYGDLLNCFEFNTLRTTASAETYCDYYSTAMMNAAGEKETFTIHYYECAAQEAWRQYALSREQGFIENYDVDGFYYDVDIAADHPKLCYDTAHSHGTRVNVQQYFFDQFAEATALAQPEEQYFAGTEMITEQMLPYVDYYQARANSGLLGWMEHDRMRVLLENGSAEKLPLFDYVYHEYGALRTDGYLIAENELGDGFYYVAAYTALNGGIPELNYEYYPEEILPSAESMNLEHLDFLDALGQARTGFGKDYLVYGRMEQPPMVDTGTTTYAYDNLNYKPYSCNGLDTLSGETTLPNVVCTAYSANGTIAIFLCNVSTQTQQAEFTLDAQTLYGVNSGAITAYTQGAESEAGVIKDGSAALKLTLEPQQIVMLTFPAAAQ